MRFLILHPNFPAQFRHIATALGADPRHQVLFGHATGEGDIPGVTKIAFKPAREPRKDGHPYLRGLESSVLQGQAAYRLALALKDKGFIPDVIYGHSGWGCTLFMKDAFPRSVLLCNFEWFYRAHGSDCDFDPSEPMSVDDVARIRMRNTAFFTDLDSCDGASCPTHWQKSQFPLEYQKKLFINHEGIDTSYFVPNPGAPLVIPRIGLDLTGAEEIVTYVARGMEPYRGFPQFIEGIDMLLKARPKLHVVIVGADRVAYGKAAPGGKGFKSLMLERFPLDPERVHFTGLLPYGEYLKVLQASSAHVYLTRPFVLSWSMLEAMSAGCVVVASNTGPVTEVIEDGFNGFLVDFFSPADLAQRLSDVIERKSEMQAIRQKARETILHRYALADLLPRRLKWMENFVRGPVDRIP